MKVTEKMKLYKIDVGAPARAVMMACDILGLKVEMIDVNLTAGEHFTPEFSKKNPLNTVPVLEDGDICLYDSHAILMYLADTYGKDDSLYPKDIKKRALVNQQFFFEATMVYPTLVKVGRPTFEAGYNKVTEKDKNDVRKIYNVIEEFLKRTKYIAGDNLTIADLSIVASISSGLCIVPLDTKKYPKMCAWMDDMEKQPYYEKYNKPGATALGELFMELINET